MSLKVIFQKYIVPVIALAGGVLFLVMGISNLVKQNTYPKTTAEITHIEVNYGVGEEPNTYEVLVKYTVNGTIYEAELDNYKNSYREGKQIPVYYNPEDPAEVIGAGALGPVISIAFGVLVLGVGIVLCLRMLYPAIASRRQSA